MKDIIYKAVNGGWVIPDKGNCPWWVDELGDGSFQLVHGDSHGIFEMSENDIFFRHDFLKGFFGEGKTQCPTCKSISKDETCCGDPVSWIYHAQQLVLSTDRKEYLKRFI